MAIVQDRVAARFGTPVVLTVVAAAGSALWQLSSMSHVLQELKEGQEYIKRDQASIEQASMKKDIHALKGEWPLVCGSAYHLSLRYDYDNDK